MTTNIRLGYNLGVNMKPNSYQFSSATLYTNWYWCVRTQVAGIAFNEDRELK